jgi:hypothetical protein
LENYNGGEDANVVRIGQLTGECALECEVRINSIEGADISKLFFNIFIVLLILVTLKGSLLRSFGSFSLKASLIRTPLIWRASYTLRQHLTQSTVLVPYIVLYQPM